MPDAGLNEGITRGELTAEVLKTENQDCDTGVRYSKALDIQSGSGLTMLLNSTFLMFLVGLALLILGAEFLVRGASRLALVLRISPLVVGLTVVAYGTSAAELAVCLRAVFIGQGALAVGTVVGSNIFDGLFVLGVSAAIRPLSVHRRAIN